MNIREKARELNIHPSTLEYRIKKGWSEDRWGFKRPIPPEGYRICSICRHTKTVDNFYKRSKRNGYLSGCKFCLKKATPKGGKHVFNVKDILTE